MAESGESACKVVKSRGQFSWTYSKPIKRYTSEMKELLTEVKQTRKILINEKYKFFYGIHIRPKWSNKMECRRIGNHNFCKERK